MTEILTTKGCLYGRNRRYRKVTHTNWLVNPAYKLLRVYEQRSSGIFAGPPVSLKYSRLSAVGTLNDEEKSKCYRMTLVGSDLRSARLSFVADTVDLFQKTLLPSFLLAGSRHASFCPPSSRGSGSPTSNVARVDGIRGIVNARTHTEKCVPMMRRWVHVPGRRLNALPSVQPRMRVPRSTSRSGSPRRFLTRSSSSLAVSPLLFSSTPSLSSHRLYLSLSTLRALSDPVCVERAMGTKLYPRWFREK